MVAVWDTVAAPTNRGGLTLLKIWRSKHGSVMCRHYHVVGLREEDVLLDDTHVGRLPQFPPAPLSQLPNSLGHLPTESRPDQRPRTAPASHTTRPQNAWTPIYVTHRARGTWCGFYKAEVQIKRHHRPAAPH